jgi:hypothetical protein
MLRRWGDLAKYRRTKYRPIRGDSQQKPLYLVLTGQVLSGALGRVYSSMPKKDKKKRRIEVKLEFVPAPDAEERLRAAFELTLAGLEEQPKTEAESVPRPEQGTLL